MAIPKIIHYCWFGGNPLSNDVLKCIESWKKYCPDYEIKEWNESNFDIARFDYMKEAYEAKKWAFVTDIARLIVVYENGGIYMDTDVELIKPLDDLLEYAGYMGYEGNNIATGLGFAAEKGNAFIKKMLDDYEGIHFIKEDGSMDSTPCPERNTIVLKEMGLRCDGSYQIIDGVHFFPEEYLCPIDWQTREMNNMTENTISIHHYTASWKKWYLREKYYNRKNLNGSERIVYWAAKDVRYLRRVRWKIKNKYRKK